MPVLRVGGHHKGENPARPGTVRGKADRVDAASMVLRVPKVRVPGADTVDEKGCGKGLEQMGRGDTAVIDREKVIYSIERCVCHVPDACRDCAYDAGHPYNECVEMLLRDALKLLKDSELVVRCKDCKHGEPCACGYGVDCDGVWHDDYGFCSDGERKEGR